MSKKEKRERIVWYLEVTGHLNRVLEDAIEKNAFKTKAEFIRQAVREKLEKEGFPTKWVPAV